MFLTIKKQQQELGNKDQKIEKTTFKKVRIHNFRKIRKADGHKSVVLTCKQKVTKARFNTKIEINLFALMNQSSQDS